MRRKNNDHLFDNILWYTLYLLPVILFIVYLTNDSYDGTSFDTFISNCGLLVSNDVTTTLDNLFSTGGQLPVVPPTVIYLGAYYVGVFLLHLAIDVLLFIPRFAHDLISGCGKKIGGD